MTKYVIRNDRKFHCEKVDTRAASGSENKSEDFRLDSARLGG